MTSSTPCSSVHGDPPGQNTRVGSHALLQGIFPIRRSNPGLLHCRRMLYHLSHQVSPRILEWVAIPFSRWSSRPRNWTRVSGIVGRFCQLSYQGNSVNVGDTTDMGSIPVLGRSPGEGHDNLLRYSCLENPMDTSKYYYAEIMTASHCAKGNFKFLLHFLCQTFNLFINSTFAHRTFSIAGTPL